MAAHEIVFSTFPGESYVDLVPYQYGREKCEPGHAFGPARRNHYLFHYIIRGKGTLLASDDAGRQTNYRLSGGEGFLISPGQVNTYYADIEDPWEYIWVEFDGIRVKELLSFAGLGTASPVYCAQYPEVRDQMEAAMRSIVDGRDASPLRLIGYTYLFLDCLTRSVEPAHAAGSKLQDFYIREAIGYIEQNYAEDINIEDIAKQAGLNRSYFGKVFKAATGKTPQQYLISYRMTKAAELLKLTALSIAEVGRTVGYPNQLHFSRAFKSVYGISPRDWRKEQLRA